MEQREGPCFNQVLKAVYGSGDRFFSAAEAKRRRGQPQASSTFSRVCKVVAYQWLPT